jgi:DNA-binding response OmpR family regulator
MERKHVFCVNGSSDFLELIRELLEEEHYNVTTTNFVPRTFQQIAALQPSLLVIDLAIRRQAGWELLERLQREAKTNQIPVIVASTDPSLLEQVQADPHRYGGDYFISKPLDLDELLAGIRGLIGEA